MYKARVLFLCVGNSAKSQMAEGFAKTMAPPDVGVFSAGKNPVQTVHPLAVEAMKNFGIDISGQRPKSIEEVSEHEFTLTVTLCPESELSCPLLAGSPVNVHWALEDPEAATGPEEELRERFVKTARKIKGLVSDLFHMGYFKAFVQQKTNLGNIINSLSEGILSHGPDRKITFFNEGAERITGFSATEVMGRDCHEIFGSPFCGPNCSFCDDYDIRNVTKRQYPTVFYNAHGVRKDFKVSVIPLVDSVGNIYGIVASFTDRSELKKLKENLKEKRSFRNIIGQDPRMIDVFEQIRNIAPHDYPVHISGETGTGKELVAQAIHYESPRSGAPFVPVNCGALPESIIESELFGHVKGAFTGATRDKKGRFELAEGGTIFLDEIGDLPMSTQSNLLRVLQEGKFERVGAEKTTSVNVRLISATNKDLKHEVDKGRFRKDLFYRLNVIPLSLPPLRKRKNDIPLLVEHFLEQAAEKSRSTPYRISDETLSVLMDYAWPGNVRELQNVIQFAIVKSRGGPITRDHLPLELRQAMENISRPGPAKKLRTEPVRDALIKFAGNKTAAAKFLGVGRATLYRFLENHPEALDARNR